jgi:hypothetical protein
LPDGPARMAPKPPGAADTLPEAGEKPTDLSPTPRAEGDSRGGRPRGRWGAKEAEAHVL